MATYQFNVTPLQREIPETQNLSEMIPGALFLLFFSLTVASSPDTWPMILTVRDTYFDTLGSQQGAILISLNFILLLFLISLIAALSFLIDKIWDFIFYYFLGGYDRGEYMPIREKLLELLPDDSESKFEIEKMPVQPIYGQFLHSFAKQTFVKWLSRRWDTYYSSNIYSISIILSIVCSIMILICFKSGLSPWTWVILVIGGIIVYLQIYTGKKRRNELLISERLFCLSVMDSDVAKAFDEISDIITRRNRYISGDIDPDLGPRL